MIIINTFDSEHYLTLSLFFILYFFLRQVNAFIASEMKEAHEAGHSWIGLNYSDGIAHWVDGSVHTYAGHLVSGDTLSF